jgi:hypothetical protein
MKPLEITFLESTGKHKARIFDTEDAVVAYLKETYKTEAPLSFRYADGSIVEKQLLDKIFERVFANGN